MANPDIDVACQSYDHTYFSFKNVFFYLCNPPSDTGDLISTCNATGVWEQFDANLQIACEEEKSSSITGKFKNIFCYHCNKNNSADGNFPTFYGAYVNVEDNVYPASNEPFEYKFKKKKQKTVHDDLISFLPAQILINNTHIDFKNIYCAICNENLEVIRNYENEMVLWDFKLRCKVFISIFYHFSLQDIIAFALNNGCRFLYKPPSSATVCSTDTLTICNMTGNWNSFDPDIVSACNNYKVPHGTENKFCSICNPSVRENILYTSCNKTGEWGEYNSKIEKNCLNMPAVEYHSPYKNIFCKECNGKNVEIYDMPRNHSTCLYDCSVDMNEMAPFIPRFRSIFKFTDYKIATAESAIQGNCLQNQIYNPFEIICIDLKCYPGRILTDEGCKPLLEMTKDIGYMVTVALNGKLDIEIRDIISFLRAVEIYLKIAMFDKGLNRWPLTRSILICQNRISWNSTNISVLVNMNISYPNYVNRTSVEDSILSFTKFILPVYYYNTTFNLSVLQNEDVYLLSTIESQSKFANTCITMDNNREHLKRYSHVKKLLMCKQIELPENETDIDNETFRLTIKSLGLELAVMDYEILPTSKVRICADQFESLILLKHTDRELDKPITLEDFFGNILSSSCKFTQRTRSYELKSSSLQTMNSS
ncbi:unnamed protein product [Mytilus coruscus]|uniref:Uncharacterized protein n=1 Tax=Mytilus coruscus TaxID=42192 RepID=A0A6J8CSD1_MYTCO|nr:unnamed protein product [Mytilus coruscus]